MNTKTHVIDLLGGPTKVAEIVGISNTPGAVQRVHNWKKRGIPPHVLISNPSFHKLVVRTERDAEKDVSHA